MWCITYSKELWINSCFFNVSESQRYGNNTINLALRSFPEALLDCHTATPIANGNFQAHRTTLLTYVLRDCSRLYFFGYVASIRSLEIRIIDIEATNTYLNFNNRRIIFQNCTTVDDYACASIYILNDINTRSSKPRFYRANGTRNHVLRHVRRLILKKYWLWKRIADDASRRAYVSACNKARKSIRKNILKHEEKLVSHPSQATFYKYINSRLIHHVWSPRYLVSGDDNRLTENVGIVQVCSK